MPFEVVRDENACSASKPWAVKNADTGQVMGCHETKQDATDQLAALNANVDDADRSRRLEAVRARLQTVQARRALATFEARCGRFGDTERRTTDLDSVETDTSGNPQVDFIVRGHAAVFNRKSLDLGFFQEIIDAGAFSGVLDADPHVLLLRDHQPGTELASTRSPKFPLELREDPRGLHFYAKVAPTRSAEDLRVLMDGGIVNQASFAFTVARDTWEIKNEGKDNETILRTIHEIDQLFDVTITAMGAYPQTDSQIVRAYAFDYAIENGRLERGATSEDAATDATGDSADTEETTVASGSEPVGGDQGAVLESKQLRRARSRAQMALARHRHLIGEHDEQDRGGSTGVAGGSRADGGAVPAA